VEAFYLRGAAKYNLGDYQGSIGDFTICIRLYPQAASSFQNRGVARSKTGDHQGAVEDFNHALRLEPENYSLYLSKVYSLLQIEQFQEAIATCDKAIKLNSRIEEAFVLRGAAHLSIEAYDKALLDLDKALQIQPAHTEALLRRALVKHELKDTLGALRDAKQALSVDSASTLAWFVMGSLHADAGKFADAITAYSRVIALNPRHALAYYNRGSAYMQTEDLREAALDFRRVTEINPRNVLGHFNLGLIYHRQKNYPKALESYDHVLALYPDMEDAWFNRALVKQELGDGTGARRDYHMGNLIRAEHGNPDAGFDPSRVQQELFDLQADFYAPSLKSRLQREHIALYPFIELRAAPSRLKDAEALRFYNPAIDSRNREHQFQPFFFLANYYTDTPDDSTAHRTGGSGVSAEIYRACLYRSRFEFDRALSLYDTLLQKYPSEFLVWFGKAGTQFYLLDLLLKLEQPDAPRRQNDLMPLGVKAVQTDHIKLNEIEYLYSRCIALRPDFAPAYFNRGLARAELEDFDSALEDFLTAFTLQPTLGEAAFNAAILAKYLDDDRACDLLLKSTAAGIKQAGTLRETWCR
jgi:tetratricopeptide (TPR) repeat protein